MDEVKVDVVQAQGLQGFGEAQGNAGVVGCPIGGDQNERRALRCAQSQKIRVV